MRTAFDPGSVNQLANLILELEDAIVIDEPLSATTRAALARRVLSIASAGESDPEQIKRLLLNRS